MGEQRSEVPVAMALVELARSLDQRPAEAFICYWTAFLSLSHGLALRHGIKPHFGLRQNGTLRMRTVDGLKMAEVYPPRSEQQIESAVTSLSDDVRHRLVSHQNVRLLAFRTPLHEGAPLRRDAHHQLVNGVLDVACTLDLRYPVWSPIDVEAYRRYIGGQQGPEAAAVLARQIIAILGTLYRNLLAASAGRSEAGDELVAAALPLLKQVVESLLEHSSE